MNDSHVGWSASMRSFLRLSATAISARVPIRGLGIREIRTQLANCRSGIRRWNSIEGDAVAMVLPGREGMGPARISGSALQPQRRHK